MQNRIHQYITRKVNNQNRTIGVMVAEYDAIRDAVVMGWSRVNVNAGDKFDRNFGMRLAVQRMQAQEMVPVPESIHSNMIQFSDRCSRYFKNAGGISKISVQPLPKAKVEV